MLYESYDRLNQFGDRYATWAKQILDPSGSPLRGFVERVWESQSPGSVDANFISVATQHQFQYLQLALTQPTGTGLSVLPDTTEIETSYRDALIDHGLSPSLAVDLIINTAQDSPWGFVIPEWNTSLLLESAREGDVRITLDPNVMSSIEAAQLLWEVASFGDIPAEFSYLLQCFPAKTEISMLDGTSIGIEYISPGDIVLSFDQQGNLKEGRVTQLLHNVTDTWLHLSNGTYVTPGHHYLRPDGSFAEIQDIVADDGRIVAADGSIQNVTAEVIRYSAETAHLFEEAEMLVYASEGGVALAPEVKRGWKTYNFTVAETHTYIADGIRVHNESVLASLKAGDVLLSVDDTLQNAAVLRDVNGDGRDEVVLCSMESENQARTPSS